MGLVNLIAQEGIVPEFYQSRATPEALAQTAVEFIQNPPKCDAMRLHLSKIRERLGNRCASDTAAAAINTYLM